MISIMILCLQLQSMHSVLNPGYSGRYLIHHVLNYATHVPEQLTYFCSNSGGKQGECSIKRDVKQSAFSQLPFLVSRFTCKLYSVFTIGLLEKKRINVCGIYPPAQTLPLGWQYPRRPFAQCCQAMVLTNVTWTLCYWYSFHNHPDLDELPFVSPGWQFKNRKPFNVILAESSEEVA